MLKQKNSKDLLKRVKYLLNTVQISFSLARVLKWKQLYKLLKRAKKLESKLDMPKRELKQFAKDITSLNFEVKKESTITRVFKILIKKEDKPIKKFEFIPFVNPFFRLFQDIHPLLLI